VLTDARGVPIAVAIAGANAHDQTLVRETFQNLRVRRPRPSRRRRQHLCADKGYDAKAIRKSINRRGYTAHIPHKGEELKTPHPHAQARRWVVERSHSWTNRARRLLIRWEKKAANYLGLLHLQFALTAWRTAGVLG
jgi:transposase